MSSQSTETVPADTRSVEEKDREYRRELLAKMPPDQKALFSKYTAEELDNMDDVEVYQILMSNGKFLTVSEQ